MSNYWPWQQSMFSAKPVTGNYSIINTRKTQLIDLESNSAEQLIIECELDLFKEVAICLCLAFRFILCTIGVQGLMYAVMCRSSCRTVDDDTLFIKVTFGHTAAIAVAFICKGIHVFYSLHPPWPHQRVHAL